MLPGYVREGDKDMKIRIIITSKEKDARRVCVERIGEVEEMMEWKAMYERYFLKGQLEELNIDIEKR